MSGRDPRLQAPVSCPSCGTAHEPAVLIRALYVCPRCQTYLSVPASVRIAMLADPRSFRELDRGLVSVDPLRFTDQRSYRDRLAEARARTGLREAVVTGEARIEGRAVVLGVFDFDFMGGTMGSVVGEKLADAFEHAARRRLPVVTVSSSGGARMQEGMLSLMQMAKTAAARAAHDRAGGAFISVLANPTFGGVAASFASLGDVIIAEPRALVGFVGPRVIEMTLGVQLPPESHRAESLFAAGMIDLIVPREDLRAAIAYLIGHLSPEAGLRRPRAHRMPALPRRRTGPVRSWQTVQLARHPQRPTAVDFIDRLFARFVELHGDRHFGDDPAVVAGLGELDDQTVVVVAQERGRTPEEQEFRRRGMALPEGYRKALRLMRLGAKFNLPVVTLIDTPGAHPGLEAEQRGIAQALAANLMEMAVLPTPVVSAVIGEGGSGGALSLGVADHVLMLEHAIYSVISPEGAAAILWRDAGRAAEVAEGLKITASDLLRLGVIDEIVPEPPEGAHADHDLAADLLRAAVVRAVRRLRRVPLPTLLRRRAAKYRHIGRVGVYWRQVVRREMQELLEGVGDRLLRRER
ncbi:MAG: acetyl-CoA carboxylase carboxyltransferase subunit alpha [Armatimonadota bacterium]|nr:acetyl-CoA carboxylase carboxyltransferase subunit alpha [Armatimonadota bacterium]MDR7452623.1 acetyl-CoA carboxylase carboxyltransferase subunit alpha [Armatimonadota bacterium]MDR7467808.1 acetyl-CoA carboxylase carboxyltransferase subunit alpha [Armatimonadota bacterium]MDR7494606.1 acetyl-CoA carboxylase carboxyltransferase subunit alpha [Armatimonadota bacterium]MDR7499666.1 acetyl-CoA carboxylase carboxyltransferase subunit alpha [Armatimonadota bacterium]